MKLTKLETRMMNILAKYPIKNTAGKYQAALTRLTNKGIVVKKESGYKLSMRVMI